MDIRAYTKDDAHDVFEMMRKEGDGWSCYYKTEMRERYAQALNDSVTYVAHSAGKLCGFVRCRDDNGFGLFVYDLLVDKRSRGNGIGKALMKKVCADYPQDTVYVMSDVDPYYEKLGLEAVGSIFQVKF